MSEFFLGDIHNIDVLLLNVKMDCLFFLFLFSVQVCSTDPVAEVRREPADHDLIGVLVPEEVDPHAVAVLVPVAALHYLISPGCLRSKHTFSEGEG